MGSSDASKGPVHSRHGRSRNQPGGSGPIAASKVARSQAIRETTTQDVGLTYPMDYRPPRTVLMSLSMLAAPSDADTEPLRMAFSCWK